MTTETETMTEQSKHRARKIEKRKQPADIGEYGIGSSIFRHVSMSGVFHFKVTGIRLYDGEIQLEAESQSCKHGWPCKVLLAQDDYGRIIHVHMLNEDEDDPQKHWHTNDGYHFWQTAALAREEALQILLRDMGREIEEAQKNLEQKKRRLREVAAAVNAIQEEHTNAEQPGETVLPQAQGTT